jgi:hypothetical protein
MTARCLVTPNPNPGFAGSTSSPPTAPDDNLDVAYATVGLSPGGTGGLGDDWGTTGGQVIGRGVWIPSRGTDSVRHLGMRDGLLDLPGGKEPQFRVKLGIPDLVECSNALLCNRFYVSWSVYGGATGRSHDFHAFRVRGGTRRQHGTLCTAPGADGRSWVRRRRGFRGSVRRPGRGRGRPPCRRR